ncbi:MAG: hypothetical protein JWO59_3205 [Chloroflexi bacterium]|nr:hypothetical protein [Chloroflexota bacterium]MDB5076783.1 hypothetical protein [Chloroflexota bacterium]
MRRCMGLLAIVVGLAYVSPPTSALAAPKPGNAHNKWCKVGNNPWCAAPEAPLPVELPLAALIVIGGFAYVVRRRHSLPELD